MSLAFGYDGPLPLSETWSGSAGVSVSGQVTRTFDDDFRLASESVDGAGPHQWFQRTSGESRALRVS